MSGRERLPGGEQRKASQKRTLKLATIPVRIEIPWKAGDKVQWRDRMGVYRRDVDEENAFVDIGGRLYRVNRRELRPG